MIGIGVSLIMTPEMAAISAFAPKDDPEAFGPAGTAAQCSALLTMATALAGVVGQVTTGAIQANSGWIATSVSIGVFAALGLVSLFFKWGYDGIVERKRTIETQPGALQEEGAEMVDVEVLSSHLGGNTLREMQKSNILKLLASFPTSRRSGLLGTAPLSL
jgi:MFS family permease